MTQKIIIDTDPGQDDAVAILLALASPREIEVLGIVAVAGNVSLAQNAKNALRVVELSGRTDIPVYAGCERPIKRRLVTAEHVHGDTGLNGPDLPDPKFVKAFVALITARVKKDRRFIIVTGGGKTCRNYQNALAQVRPVTDDDNDWMGIYATQFNGELMRLAFGKLAHKEVAIRYGKKINFTAPVLVGAGEKPGHSTDYDAVLLANMFDAKHVVNVSNTDYVYTADPRKDKKAKPLPTLSWNQYLALLPKKWTPGLSSPFDMKASALAKKAKLTVSIVNGGNLDEVAKAIDHAPFKGSIIAS